MDREYLRNIFIALFLFIFSVSGISVNDQRLAKFELSKNNAWATFAEDKKLTENDFSYILRPKNISCILANMEIAITVPYKSKDKDEKKTITVPKDAKISGNCADVIADMSLNWKAKKENNKEGEEDNSGNKEKKDNNPGNEQAEAEETEENIVKFTFLNDHANFAVFSIDVDIYLDSTNFPNAASKRFTAKSEIDLGLFAASSSNGIHKCDLEVKHSVGGAEIAIKNSLLIAFNRQNDISNRKEEKCSEKDKKSSSFPFVVKPDKSNACLLAKMSISVEAAYNTNSLKEERGIVNVPLDAKVSGDCSSRSSKIKLSWNESAQNKSPFDSDSDENSISISFVKDKNNTFAHMVEIEISQDKTNFPNAVDPGKKLTGLEMDKLFLTSAENGLYSCPNNVTIKMDNFIVQMSDILLVPFDVEKDFATKNVAVCEPIPQKLFDYELKDGKGNSCILANMSIALDVPYKKEGKDANAKLKVPKNAEVSGTCGDVSSEMKLTWTEPEAQQKNYVEFLVGRNETDSFVYQIKASIYLDKKNFAGSEDSNKAIDASSFIKSTIFPAPVENGIYKCSDQKELVNVGIVKAYLADVAFIAFNKGEDIDKRKVNSCPAKADDDTGTISSSTTDDPNTPPTTAETTTSQPANPSVAKYKYVVTNPDTHIACIMADMTISMKIPYQGKDSKTQDGSLRVPTNASANGKCGESSSTMEIIWKEEKAEEENKITLTFKKDESKFYLGSLNIAISLDQTNFPDATVKKYEATSEDLVVFSSSLNSVYECQPETAVKIKEAGMTINDVSLIAFNTEENVSSKTVENCLVEQDDNTGAIVGGIIGGLILIAIAVYLFITYRNRGRFF